MKDRKYGYSAIFLVLAVLLAGMAHAETLTLLSAETGTATGDPKTFSKAVKDFTEDVITLGTGTVVVRTDCNASGDDSFDTTGMGDTITCGLGVTKCTAVYNSQPMTQCRAVITSATGTNSTTVKLLGVQ